MVILFKEQQIAYDALKTQLWSFVDRFSGGKSFSMGDARALISMVADIAVIEQGYDYVSALAEALNFVHTVVASRTVMGLAEEMRRVYRRWLEVRHELKKLLELKRLRTGVSAPRAAPPVKLGGGGLTLISMFTGAYGLDLGFELAGFDVVVALDISEASYQNLKANRPRTPFLLGDIAMFRTEDILKEAGLKPGEVDVLTGGPPCQPFSPAGKRQSLSDPRASPLKHFIRVIAEARPKVFIMEEVPGILSARIRHVPISERGTRPLTPEEEPGSAWRVILEELRKTGYIIEWKVLNAADYGVPQERERVIVIGVRPDLRKQPRWPAPTHSRKPQATLLGTMSPWLTLLEAISDIDDHIGLVPLPSKYSRFISYVPPGGNWRHIPDELKHEAMGRAYTASGGRMGFYRRLAWFEPSPTLVTSPAMKATMMVHPWEDRPLSVKEYLRIQGFPDDWRVVVGTSDAYRLFGEAVPVRLAKAIAEVVRSILSPQR
jgi:DNA (cytosine-5)-methyltransferase 1